MPQMIWPGANVLPPPGVSGGGGGVQTAPRAVAANPAGAVGRRPVGGATAAPGGIAGVLATPAGTGPRSLLGWGMI